MPPPHDGNQHLPFVDLIELEKIDDVTYKSITLPFSPGGQTPGAFDRAYGGHVYMQAAWAACHTVKQGLLIYVCQNREPFIYHVQKIRDGKSFSTRIVNVTQGDSEAICWSGLISFKLPEEDRLNVQEKVDLWEEYNVVLKGKKPPDFPEPPGMDVPWYWQLRRETGQNDEFPGLDMTKVDMTEYDKDKNPIDRRGLMFYRATGPLPPDPNIHICAHLYASDRNSLYIVTNQLEIGDLWTQMSTLVHMTMFHGSTEDLMFGSSKSTQNPMDDSEGKWFAKDDWSTRSSHGRANFHGRLWAADGTQVATISQDGLIRYTKKAEATKEELEALQLRKARWKPREKL